MTEMAGLLIAFIIVYFIFAIIIFPLLVMSIFAVSVLFPYIIGAVALYLLWKFVKKRA
jgi:hypothetical protein